MRYSAGIAVVRPRPDGAHDLLIVHPGGPFWRNKDSHAWSIPKGELDPGDDDPEQTARREFTEETGQPVPPGPLRDLGEFAVSSGKKLRAYFVEGDLDADAITEATSNTFELEWPPRSGTIRHFPEVDRAMWVRLDEATAKLHKGQATLVALLDEAIRSTAT